MKRPAPWALVLSAALIAGWVPGLPPPVSMALGGLAGLVFAAHYGALATCVARTHSPADLRVDLASLSGWWSGNAKAGRAASAARDRHEARVWAPSGDDRETDSLSRNLLRFAFVLLLLALSGIVAFLNGSGQLPRSASPVRSSRMIPNPLPGVTPGTSSTPPVPAVPDLPMVDPVRR
jgi:hypothetical protein